MHKLQKFNQLSSAFRCRDFTFFIIKNFWSITHGWVKLAKDKCFCKSKAYKLSISFHSKFQESLALHTYFANLQSFRIFWSFPIIFQCERTKFTFLYVYDQIRNAIRNDIEITDKIKQTSKWMVFCYQNCSDLQWEKNVLVSKIKTKLSPGQP